MKNLTLLLSLIVLSAGCSKANNVNSDAAILTSNAPATTQGPVQLQITLYNSQNNAIYTEGGADQSLIFATAATYNLHINAQNAPSNGTTITLQSTDIDSPSQPTAIFNLQVGDNVLVAPEQGNYTWKIVVVINGQPNVTKYYQAQVTCSASTVQLSGLDSSQISVTNGSDSNLYNFSAAGVIDHATGQAPYTCAWDLSGVDIVDTPFQDCNVPLSDQYVNDVGVRNIGLIVRDSCNNTQVLHVAKTLAWTQPAQPNYIVAQTSNATQALAADARTNNVQYLATNPANTSNAVSANYGQASDNLHSSFTISAQYSYQQLSSVTFGVGLQIENLGGQLDLANQTGSIYATAATDIKNISYTTDQIGDQAPAISLNGHQCTLNLNPPVVQFLAGSPCAAGQTGTGHGATVEISGSYSCQAIAGNTSGTMDISGSFDGEYVFANDCQGGSSSSGGGITPISF